MNRIEITKTIETGVTKWSIKLNGEPCDHTRSRTLTGTTGENGEGVFKYLCGNIRTCLYYGDFDQTFAFPAVFCNSYTVAEARDAFVQRVTMVREWVASLPKDRTDTITFDL